MFATVEIPIWLLVLIVMFAVVTLASHLLFPSVRWFFRKRAERLVARLNEKLDRPIEPFKLARRHDMIQRLIYDPEVAIAIAEHSDQEEVPENVAFEMARRYAREIVPSFSASAYFGFGTRISRWFARLMYNVDTSQAGSDQLKSINPDSTVIYVMNHRSNMDYMLVTYLAARSSALSYAVGEWARVWPLSQLIRSMGAYFIRRKSRNALYRKVLARYVQLATAGGVAQAVFPEGGLSLNGKLQAPKMGLLSYIAQGAKDQARDVVFVPVGLNYDRVLEDRMLIAADRAGTRRFPARMSVIVRFTLRKLWQRVRGRFLRFGHAAVQYGAPLSLKEFGPERPVEELADELMQRIGQVIPVLPVPLMAQVLLKADGPVEEAKLRAAFEAARAALPSGAASLDAWGAADVFDTALVHLLNRHLATRSGSEIMPSKDEVAVLRYYANSIQQHIQHDAAAAQITAD